MTQEFFEFLSNVRNGIDNGEIKLSKPLTDLDIAVQFAVGKIGEQRGYPLNITAEEIASKVLEFAPELLPEE